MFRSRIIFGPIMIVSLLGLFWLDNAVERAGGAPGLTLTVAFVAIILLGARELAILLRARQVRCSGPLMGVGAAGLCLITAAAPLWNVRVQNPLQWTLAAYASWAFLLLIAALLLHGFRLRQAQGAMASAGAALLALTYLGVPPACYLLIRQQHDAWVLAAILLITKACDIGAYFTGSLIGRRKLIPWLSPGKTWEGLLGGVALAAALAVALALFAGWPALPAAVSAGLLAGLGQLGDLIASLFKRDAGLKDASSLVPGFGGVLDILDSPLLVGPVAYWLLAG